MLWRLRLPSALPAFFGGLRIACGLALDRRGGRGIRRRHRRQRRPGLAYQILQAGYQLNIPRLFAALLLITVAGVMLFAAMTVAGRVVLARWHESEREE